MVDRWIVEPENSIESNRRRRVCCRQSSLQPSHSLCRDMATAPLMASQAKDMDLPKVVAVGRVDWVEVIRR